MQRISITNPQNIIDGTAKKYYFKLRNTSGPKGDKGDKGDTGSRGPQGEPGNAATVYVGSTTTLPVGQDATVENVGTQYNAVLNFGIPQGPQGPQGDKGDKGDTGAKGDTGPRGPQGERGTNATVYVGTTTTTNPGTQARVYNSGTDSNAVLNFEIPRGDVGPQPELVQSTGTSTTKAMSQNATTVALNGKQNTLTAGSNIQISSNTISATDTTYTAGNGLNLNGTEFSADTTVLATQTDIAPKLETEVVAELPTTGEDGVLYLVPKSHTTQTASGNPISVNITDNAGKIESLKLDGDTFQQTYTGQNLYNVAQVSTGTYVTKDDDGWITITRDNTSGGSTVYTNVWTSNLALETSTQYKIFIEVKAVSGTGSLFVTSTNSTQGQFNSWQEKNLANMAAGQTYTVAPTTKSSFSGISQGLRTVFQLTAGQGGSVTFRLSVCASSTPTETFSYEPYVGGVPSPNPEYPQSVQTVTGRQTVEVRGKNLYNFKPNTAGLNGLSVTYDKVTGLIHVSGTPTANWANIGQVVSDNLPAGNYILWVDNPNPNYRINLRTVQGGTNVDYHTSDGGSSVTFTTTGDSSSMYAYIDHNYSLTTIDWSFRLMLEAGSTATNYEPYSSNDYEIDLGSIELCKIGDYQDYIYENEGKWYVRKEVGGITLSGSEGWVAWGSGDMYRYYTNSFSSQIAGLPQTVSALSDYFRFAGVASGNLDDGKFFFNMSSGTTVANGNITFITSTIATVANWKTWLASNNTTVYCPLATPTDTEITNTALIDQLEAIRTASLENGTNTITNTATGTNLAGDMEIGYYGYNPTNRYDKFIWLDLNNAYEQLNNPDTSSTLSTLSTRSLGATTEQPTVTRSLETETITLKKGETEPIEEKTELPTILDEEAEETETTEPEESDGTDER